MLHEDADRVWGTDYTVDEIKVLITSGAVPKDFIEILPGGAMQVSAFVLLTMRAFAKAELGEDWAQILGDYFYQAATDPNLNDKIKEALGWVLSAEDSHEAESDNK